MQHGDSKHVGAALQVVEINDYQKQYMLSEYRVHVQNWISGKKIAVLGFAFKKVGGCLPLGPTFHRLSDAQTSGDGISENAI